MAKRKRDKPPAAIAGTRAANSWGLPDWTDAEGYGDWRNWELVRWRWEFHRRNPEYRAQWLAFFDVLEAREVAANNFRKLKTLEARNRFSELADIQERAFDAFWKRWGDCEVLDPRVSDYSDEKLKTLPFDGFNMMDGSSSTEAGKSFITPRIGQTVIIFDLARPLEQQINNASVALKLKQEAMYGKIQWRQHKAKWIGYLQTLDAFEVNAPWAEIALLHPHTKQTDQTVRDIRDQAKELCFNF